MQPYNQTEPKKDQIRDMFDHIAPRYDMLNHVLSLGIDRGWRRKTVRMVRKQNPSKILDLATGTGDMAISLAKKCKDAVVTGADLSENMLKIAKEKVAAKKMTDRIELLVAEAENLPFEDGVFDTVTIAFGIRNFHNIPQSLKEIHRILKPGGKLYILEFSVPRSKIFGFIYRFYFHKVLPFVGGLVSKDKNAYKYLPDSVDEFPSSEKFSEMVLLSGFEECRMRSLSAGISYIYTGVKSDKNKM